MKRNGRILLTIVRQSEMIEKYGQRQQIEELSSYYCHSYIKNSTIDNKRKKRKNVQTFLNFPPKKKRNGRILLPIVRQSETIDKNGQCQQIEELLNYHCHPYIKNSTIDNKRKKLKNVQTFLNPNQKYNTKQLLRASHYCWFY